MATTRSERKAQKIAQTKVLEIKNQVTDLDEDQLKELYAKELNFARTEIAKRKEIIWDVACMVGGVVAATGLTVLGFKAGAKYMDEMICKGAIKGGIHKNLKDGGRIVCKYLTKEEVEAMAKEVVKEVV